MLVLAMAMAMETETAFANIQAEFSLNQSNLERCEAEAS